MCVCNQSLSLFSTNDHLVDALQTVLALKEVTANSHRLAELEAIVHLQGTQLESNDTLVASLRDEITALSPLPTPRYIVGDAAAQEFLGDTPPPPQHQQQEIFHLTEKIKMLERELSTSRIEFEELNNKVC